MSDNNFLYFFKKNESFLFKTSVVFLYIIATIVIFYILFVTLLPFTLKKMGDLAVNQINENIYKQLPEEYFLEKDEELKKRILIKYIVSEVEPYADELRPLFTDNGN